VASCKQTSDFSGHNIELGKRGGGYPFPIFLLICQFLTTIVAFDYITIHHHGHSVKMNNFNIVDVTKVPNEASCAWELNLINFPILGKKMVKIEKLGNQKA
jgi:hypothetical protein